MEKEKETNENPMGIPNASRRLSTWLPVDVFYGFTEFAKHNAKTGLDKFDYGVALRILLMKSAYLDLIYDSYSKLSVRLDELEERLDGQGSPNSQNLQGLQDKEIKGEDTKGENTSEVPEGYYKVKTMGEGN